MSQRCGAYSVHAGTRCAAHGSGQKPTFRGAAPALKALSRIRSSAEAARAEVSRCERCLDDSRGLGSSAALRGAVEAPLKLGGHPLLGSCAGARPKLLVGSPVAPQKLLRGSSSKIRPHDSAHSAQRDGAPPHPRSSAQNWPLLEAPSPPPPTAIPSAGQRGSLVASTAARHARSGQMAIHTLTVWPSGLRRWLQAPVRKGVGSNPTAVTCCPRHAAARAGARSTSPCDDAATFAPWRDVPSRGRNQHGKACSVTA